MSEQAQLSTVKDPILAVILERMTAMSISMNEHRQESQKSFEDHRREVKEAFERRREETREEKSEINKRLDLIEQNAVKTTKMLNTARGGYLVILGMGGLAAAFLTGWDQLLRIFHIGGTGHS